MSSKILNSVDEVLALARQGGITSCIVELEKTNNAKYIIMSQDRYIVSKYANKEQLDRFLQLIDVSLTPFMEKDTLIQGRVTIYKPSKEFQIEYLHQKDYVSELGVVHKLRGIIVNDVVDNYVKVQENLVSIYRPMSFILNQGFNKSEGATEFYKQNGSLNIEK
ncbi:hypothetical protein [Bacillus toyonensis]|uniref:hypothetical protein n=1 Tax=Bacillus toyonensis TaxID=155322 RepID=UPI000BF8629A|nr:hypothetical protein [Bacillus toyonensis]PGF04971.1 hypothetical protein COM61_00590 [Bacillus toyonensis]